MPEPGRSSRCCGEPGEPVGALGQREHPEAQRLAVELAAQHERLGVAGGHPELVGDVGGHPVVGRGRRRQHRHAVGQLRDERAQPPVVGPEVVPPVGDAVRLVDDEHPGGAGELGQHLVAELGVVQTLGADEQDVDLAGLDLAVDQRPVVGVGGVDRDRVDAGAVGRLDLVAHEREQRADDHRRALPAGAQQRRGHEVDRRLAPPGALHHQRPPALGHQRVDRRPLVLAQRGVGPGQALQRGLGVGAQIGLGRDGHGSMVDDGSDRPGGGAATHTRSGAASRWRVSSAIRVSAS